MPRTALCPSCRKEITLLLDGTIRRHQRPSSPRRFGHPPCAGSGHTPEQPDRDPQSVAAADAAQAAAVQAIRDAADTAASIPAAARFRTIADEIDNHHA